MLDALADLVNNHGILYNMAMLIVMVLVMVLVLHGYAKQDADMIQAGGWILLFPAVVFLLLGVADLTSAKTRASVADRAVSVGNSLSSTIRSQGGYYY